MELQQVTNNFSEMISLICQDSNQLFRVPYLITELHLCIFIPLLIIMVIHFVITISLLRCLH